MSDNEMIIIDDDSPPPLTNLSLEPTSAPVETKDVQSKMDDFVTKETRQVRQRKLLRKDDYVYDDNSSASSPNSSGDEIDDVDTDDLLSQADNLPPLRYNSVGRAISTSKSKRRTTRRRKPVANVKKQPPRRRIDDYRYDPDQVRQLAEAYPDTYWTFHADSPYPMIDIINQDCPLGILGYNVTDQGAITGMTLSPDGTLLATFSTMGVVKIWDVANEFNLLRRIRDLKEENIEEFYCGQFSPSQELIAAGGKLKDRFRWSVQDDDNHILPCPLKLFNVETGQLVTQLDGHAEEILCVKALTFKGENYFITTSQDGYIIKWKMEENWSTLIESTKMEDGITCMAFTVSFVPNTGNKFFIAACDAHLRLFDFEEALLLQTFEDIYSSYCDCGKFVKWLDQPVQEGTNNEAPHAYFISRGAEMCDVAEGVSSIPNTCTLHKLVFPTASGEKFQLEQVRKFNHEDYHANCWFVKITSNGRYLLAPTIYGQIFVFNMASGQVTAVLKDHQDMEIRDVIFHPYRPLLFSCGDDGCVKVYTFREPLPPSPAR